VIEDGVAIEAVYDDPHLVELVVTAENECGRGRVSVYVGITELDDCAAALKGFPTSLSDRRSLEWGDLAPDSPIGGARFEFSCLDGSGHTAVWVTLKTGDVDPGPAGQSVRLCLRFDPASLDRLVGELRSVGQTKRGVARLAGGRTRG
jgi:hypothetical protein